MNREDLLHNAICQAVSIMNMSIDIARSADGRKAKDILRKALFDYADAVKEVRPAPSATPAIQNWDHIPPKPPGHHPRG